MHGMTPILARQQDLTEQMNANDTCDGNRTLKQAGDKQPGWICSLRQLYDATLSEPLPNSLEELLHTFERGEEQTA